MPGTLLTIWFVSPWPMKPAPTMPTRIGLPCASRALSAVSTIITMTLGRWRKLEMHPTQRALAIVEGDVGLRDQRLQSVLGELVLAKRPREEPSAVLARLDVDDECASELRFLKDHSFSPVTRPPDLGS